MCVFLYHIILLSTEIFICCAFYYEAVWNLVGGKNFSSFHWKFVSSSSRLFELNKPTKITPHRKKIARFPSKLNHSPRFEQDSIQPFITSVWPISRMNSQSNPFTVRFIFEASDIIFITFSLSNSRLLTFQEILNYGIFLSG